MGDRAQAAPSSIFRLLAASDVKETGVRNTLRLSAEMVKPAGNVASLSFVTRGDIRESPSLFNINPVRILFFGS